MSEDKPEKKLPVRSLHEFLFEISSEWDRFRSGSLLSVVISGLVALAMLVRFLGQVIRREPFEALITLSIIITLAFNIWLSWRQHDFYRRWEKRIGLLMHTEEELLGD